MPEPTATATLVAAAVTVPALSVLGVPLGLRPDVLIAGFSGALVAIALLDSVPSTGDTWRELVRTTQRRMAVTCASSLVAGYLAPVLPVLPLMPALPEPLLLFAAFVTGAAAQQVLRAVIRRYVDKIDSRAGEPQP